MLAVNDLELAFDSRPILQVREFTLSEAEIGCILGPSGEGKSSFLRAICGLMRPIRGNIRIDDKEVFSEAVNLAANNRNLGMVFQDICLFPHMTVKQNIAYGLHKLSKLDAQKRIDELLTLTDLTEFADRFPYELSGGQQQRVGIARAIAPRPKLLLMDEPFSSLDPMLREQLAFDLRQMLKTLNITTLIVTHDQKEAFALADKMAVFGDKQCLQFDSPYKLYHQPVNAKVARFIGDSFTVQGVIKQKGESWIVETALGSFTLPEHYIVNMSDNQQVEILLRPDDIIHDDSSGIQTAISGKQFRGSHIMFTLKCKEQSLFCLAPSHHNHRIGESFGIRIDIKHLLVFKK